MIIAKAKALTNIGFETFSKMFQAAVAPVCDYSSAVWGYADFPCLKNVQNRALRFFLGVHRFAPNSAIQGDMGWCPSVYRRHLAMIQYWNRLIHMDDTRLTKKVFLQEYHSSNLSTWCTEVKSLLNQAEMDDIYENGLPCDLSLFKPRFAAITNLEWQNGVHAKPKLRTYKMFKTDLHVEPYLTGYLFRRARSLLAQFRMSILPLNIEVGRYSGIAPENRFCTMCTLHVPEDEIHFLCH